MKLLDQDFFARYKKSAKSQFRQHDWNSFGDNNSEVIAEESLQRTSSI